MAASELQHDSIKCKVEGCSSGAATGRKGLCMRHYRRQRRTGSTEFPVRFDYCQAEGCANSPRSAYARHCDTHHHQLRRNGYIGPKRRPRLINHSQGYKLLAAPGHPLSTPGQTYRIFEHRAVYYEHHGNGPFDCVHCGNRVTWKTMHVDHLDDDPTNNVISNLGASCPTCNQFRGRSKMRRTMRQRRSTQITWQGRTQSVADWAEELGVPTHRIKQRLKAGWSVDRAMTEPRGVTGPR